MQTDPMRLLFIFLLIRFTVSEPEVTVSLEDTVGKQAWIDPNDPTRGMDLSHQKWIDPNDPTYTEGKMRSGTTRPAGYGNRADNTIKRILRSILYDLHVDPKQGAAFTRTALISLGEYQMERISAFLDAETENDWDSHEKLCNAVEKMITVIEEEDLDRESTLQLLVSFVQPYLLMLNVLVLLPAAFIVLRFLISTRSLLLVAFLCIFAFSMWTTYDRRYKEEMASRLEASALYKDSCRPPTFIESGFEFMKGLVTIRKKSECRQFIESQTKSIMSDIPLTEILSEVIFNGFLSFLAHLGKHLNKFFINLYDGMPLPIAIIATVLVAFSIIFLSGYRITTPFTSFEPHGPSTLAQIASGITHVAAQASIAPQQIHQPMIPQHSHQAFAETSTRALPAAPERRSEKRILPTVERWPPADRESDQESRNNQRNDSMVSPRSPQRRSRMIERRGDSDGHRSISLPRKYQ